ncbi:MAG: Ribonuclease J (endonuclease and 5' exonuclease) [uncultured Thermomicrobiales bacterium]|uniref:Ribonuclease J n=1 Tax=uncultured Thermomicrobiales bacterium TaxID=1645740 RepID=A0A6J4U1D0_9BACT|nr:MAG: Ribonuclease J (endonuclease and 5' exonuclease) [uncultured Thermomicrobiales bacterium]
MAEVGRNMLLLEAGEDIVVVDCGVGFPHEEQLGIDLVLPDIAYLRGRADRVRAIFVTHGHEDHIGALPFLLPEIPATVYGTPLTIGLIAEKLDERGLLHRADLQPFDPDAGVILEAGVFYVEPFRVCHSIPDAVGFGITTPAGLIVHTGDFKFDPTPVDGKLTDEAKLAEFRERGVRLLVSDCVHVETAAATPSERVVGEAFGRVFAAAPGRIFVATFASHIHRVQQVLDAAGENGRSVAALGRSLERNLRVARELGYVKDPTGTLVDHRVAAGLPDERVVYLVTGSQGEDKAVLGRLARDQHRSIAIGPGDTVVVSASPIPGNEVAVFGTIDRLFAAGANVVYPARDRVHVSGHAGREEIGRMLDLLQPRHALPFHGEPRHMALYADLAVERGMATEEITFAAVGSVIEVTPERVVVTGQVEAGIVYVDDDRVAPLHEVVIRDRRILAREGVLIVALTVAPRTGAIVAGPEIETRGFVYVRDSAALLAAAADHLRRVLVPDPETDWATGWQGLSRQIRDATAAFLFRETRRRPMILPVVSEYGSGERVLDP